MDKEYAKALQQSKDNLAELKERGEVDEWTELRQEIFSPQEILESDLRAKKIVNALTKSHVRKKQIFKSLNL